MNSRFQVFKSILTCAMLLVGGAYMIGFDVIGYGQSLYGQIGNNEAVQNSPLAKLVEQTRIPVPAVMLILGLWAGWSFLDPKSHTVVRNQLFGNAGNAVLLLLWIFDLSIGFLGTHMSVFRSWVARGVATMAPGLVNNLLQQPHRFSTSEAKQHLNRTQKLWTAQENPLRMQRMGISDVAAYIRGVEWRDVTVSCGVMTMVFALVGTGVAHFQYDAFGAFKAAQKSTLAQEAIVNGEQVGAEGDITAVVVSSLSNNAPVPSKAPLALTTVAPVVEVPMTSFDDPTAVSTIGKYEE